MWWRASDGQVEGLNKKINELKKEVKKLDDMYVEKMNYVKIGGFSIFVMLFVLLFKSV